MGTTPYRSHHQITSKCNKLKTNVTRFAAIYNKLVLSRSSGSSDADILSLAYRRYREEHRSAFVHEHCWSIIKHNPKWTVVPPMTTTSTDTSRGTKRSKTSDDSDAHFYLLDDDAMMKTKFKNLNDPSEGTKRKRHQRVIRPG
jgi:hypothetical protein